jgi:hypothetical protein
VLRDVGELLRADREVDVLRGGRELLDRSQPSHGILELGAERHAQHLVAGLGDVTAVPA